MSIKVNGVLVEQFTFPNGEVGIKWNAQELTKQKSEGNLLEVQVVADIKNSDDLISFLLFQDMLFEERLTVPYTLILPFLPYSRADRKFENMPFSLKWFCNQLAWNLWTTIESYDVHNPKVPEWFLGNKFDNVMVKTSKFSNRVLWDIDSESTVCIVCPDEGAWERASDLYESMRFEAGIRGMNLKFKSCQFTKERDEDTGQIKSIHPSGGNPPEADYYIIVDDICDGGGTFLGVAKYLPSDKKKFLFVTHGYFTKGTEQLTNVFNRVYTSNTVYEGDDPNVIVV